MEKNSLASEFVDLIDDVKKVAKTAVKATRTVVKAGVETGAEELKYHLEEISIKYGTLLLGAAFILWGVAKFLDDWLNVPGGGYILVGIAFVLIAYWYSGTKKHR